ncbi:MAG TPA: protein kinase, partial [Pirellulales bacterium]|nr:protein kinase [Pirellulales bacterium]
MHSFAQKTGWLDLEACVEAFEEAQVRNGRAELTDFLPPAEHPNRRDVLLELVRVDLEYCWQRGDSCMAENYQARFPELFDDPHAAGQVEFEVERLRRRTTDECTFPEVGDEFLGFHLVGELGRGAFGRVFLAEQEGLANRTVALKVSKTLFGESQTLAQLQHTNIVPIHSVHLKPPFQAVCMPYFGGTTLADVLKLLRGNSAPPVSGLGLLSTLRGAASFHDHTTPTPSGTARHHWEKPAAGEVKPTAADGGSPLQTAALDGVLHADGDDARPGRVPRARLAGLSYVEAVLWIVSRLADGLDHAHARGVLHRDLKPANILLAHEGQPMLLDFNLSANVAATARVGGTLQYMSPEQIAALDGQRVTLDAQPAARIGVASDVYSLGIVLYEMLSLRHPFPWPAGTPAETSTKSLADRRRGPPPLGPLNRAISPAVESIVRHALEFDPRRRYRSARELQEDIERQLDHRPLRCAPEVSWRERTAKWVRRHPRLTSTTSIVLAGLTTLLFAAGAWTLVERREARLDALEQFRRFETELPAVLYPLNGSHLSDRPKRAFLLEQGRRLLAQYRVEDDGHWYDGPHVANLDDGLQRKLRDRLGGLSLSLAAATIYVDAGAVALEQALKWNRLAERCFSRDDGPRALWTQRAELLRILDRNDEAKAAAARAVAAPTRPSHDHYWEGFARAQRHDYPEAISAFEAATEEDPRFFWSWFQLGRAHDALARYQHAAHCYTVCIALLPDSGDAYFHRGLARLNDGLYAPALADFDHVLQLLPDLASVYLDRGDARLGLNEPKVAVVDYTRAVEMGADEARALLGRSKARGL